MGHVEFNHKLPHIIRSRERIEDLWLKGTDYDRESVQAAMAENRMLHLDMDFTDACDLGCFYCDRTPDRFSKDRKKKLTTDDRKDIIRQAKALGAETVEFPGAGEPMQDSGFWEIMEYINDLGMTSVVFTAGHRIDDKAVDRLFDLGVSVFLKYSTFADEINDKYVKMPGYTKHAREVMDKLVAKGFNKPIPTRLALDMIVTKKHTFEQVGKVHRWCRDNNVHSYISYLIPEGRSDVSGRMEEAGRSDELLEYIAEIDLREYGLTYDPVRPMIGGYRCRQVNIGMFVNVYGQVYDCNGLGRPFLNVFDSDLETIWNSSVAQKVRKHEQEGFCVVRERVWSGTKNKGLDRKVEDYSQEIMEEIGDKISVSE